MSQDQEAAQWWHEMLPYWGPQTYREAVARWSPKIVACTEHEWNNRTAAENTLWLLEQLRWYCQCQRQPRGVIDASTLRVVTSVSPGCQWDFDYQAVEEGELVGTPKDDIERQIDQYIAQSWLPPLCRDTVIRLLREERYRTEQRVQERRIRSLAPQKAGDGPAHDCQPIQWGRINKFFYTNYRGEVSKRRVLPLTLNYEKNEFHPDACWQLLAWDLDKNALRHFALHDIHVPG